MPITFRCPECDKLLKVADETAGKRAKCPNCSAVLTVPAADSPSETSSPFAPLPSDPPDLPDESPFGVAPPVEQPPEINPYASPSSGGYEPTSAISADIVPTIIDIGDVISRAWQMYKVDYLICITVVVVAGLLNMVASYAQNFFVMGVQMAGAGMGVIMAVQFITTIAGFLFQTWIGAGQTAFLIKLGRGDNPEFTVLFSGGKYLLRMIGMTILMMLIVGGIVGIVAVVVIVTQAMTNDGQITAIVGLVLGLPAAFVVIYVSLMLSQAGNLIIDRDMGVIESFSVSSTVTQGNKLLIFVLGIVAGLIALAGVLACCVGVLFTGPFAYFIMAVAYLVMTGQRTGDQQGVTA